MSRQARLGNRHLTNPKALALARALVILRQACGERIGPDDVEVIEDFCRVPQYRRHWPIFREIARRCELVEFKLPTYITDETPEQLAVAHLLEA
jgi:hypothetical protein